MSTGLAGSGRNYPQWFPVTSLCEKVLVAYLADWLLMTLTVDVPYLIVPPALFPPLGCVLAHVASYGMMAQHVGQPSQARSGDRENVESHCDSRGRDSAGYRLQYGCYRRTVGQATQRNAGCGRHLALSGHDRRQRRPSWPGVSGHRRDQRGWR